MKTRTKAAQDNDEGITSPSVNVGPNPSVTSKLLTIKLGPLTQKSSPQSALNAVDGGSHQHPKHGHSDSDADTEVTVPNLCQPSAKRTKNSNTTSPVKSAPDQKQAQHTPEEMATATKQTEDLRLRQEAAEKKKIQMLVEMEAAQEEEECLEETTAVWNLTDLAESKENPKAGDNNVTMTTSKEESIEKNNNPVEKVELEGPVTPVKMKKKAARARGDICAAIDKEKEAIRNDMKSNSRPKKLTQKTPSKPAVKTPSGLVPDWKTKRSKVLCSALDTKCASSPLGGLADDDTIANNSDFIEYKSNANKASATSNQKNAENIVIWDSDSDFIVYERSLAESKGPGCKSSSSITKTKSHISGKSASQPSDNSPTSDSNALPEFVWDEMLKSIQQVINIVYPGNTYQARWGDKICLTVNSHLYAKRSSIGSCAVQVVEEFFKAERFHKNSFHITRTPSTFLNPSSLSKPFHLSSKGARIPVKTSVGEVWFETDPNSV
ncbi:hypothetical protein DFH94DRAFT_683323 [Russula ochroleuca]|uniref:Uncharacterized protein n=1 Tax=Russula ochroleuca TaxID=152965 RepID=A0A9P5T5T5_9AGAM|nr:hypothetical protein DFH94DRAFT_683323 [Russula ochroleuca]